MSDHVTLLPKASRVTSSFNTCLKLCSAQTLYEILIQVGAWPWRSLWSPVEEEGWSTRRKLESVQCVYLSAIVITPRNKHPPKSRGYNNSY